MQMSILLTYVSLYDELVSTYEPVLIQRFLHSRADAVWSSTSKITKLCCVWVDPVSSIEQKIEAPRETTQHHSLLIDDAVA